MAKFLFYLMIMHNFALKKHHYHHHDDEMATLELPLQQA